MANYNFSVVGSPGAVSQGFNNYINGFIGIQPDQGVLQDMGTLIGHQMNANSSVTGWALHIEGETDKNNTELNILLFAQPKVA